METAKQSTTDDVPPATQQSSDCPAREHEATTVRRIVMFWIALGFLLLTAFSLHHFDDPSADPNHGRVLGWMFAILWMPIFIEAVAGYWRTADYSWPASARLLLIWLVPPYRMILATYPGGNCVWLPIIGWQPTGRDLEERLDRGFSIPMLFIALMILPILAIEMFGGKYVDDYPMLGRLLNFGTSVIWLAFAFEFIVMSSITPALPRFLGKNWINLLVILLPLIAFLRGFRAARLLRLGRATKALKVYRLRGLGIRAWRGVLTLELIDRVFFRKPEARLTRLKAKLQDHERNVLILKKRIALLEEKIASSDE
jgi:voltage-gated potassium channel